VLIPAPSPTYALAPGLPALSANERRMVGRVVESLTGEVTSALVTSVRRTDRHLVVELLTPDGPVVVLERMRPPTAYVARSA
jgi:hypothetical protein